MFNSINEIKDFINNNGNSEGILENFIDEHYEQFDLTMRIFEDSLKLANTIDKIEDVLDNTNIENCDELVEGFLQIKSIIETTKILESEE